MMTPKKSFILGTMLFLAGLAQSEASGLIACSDIKEQWQGVKQVPDMDVWSEFYDKAFNDSDCEGPEIDKLGLQIIDAFLPKLESRVAEAHSGDELEGLREQLDDLITFGTHWRVLFLIGELYRQDHQVGKAYQSYREALSIIDDEEITPDLPSEGEVGLLRSRLDETGLIYLQAAKDPAEVKPSVTRSGKPGSAMSFSTRGYKRKKTLVPLQFVFGKAELTNVGQESFKTVLDALKRQGSPNIEVIGHTDPVGSDANNMALSLLRAEVVRQQLKAQGYEGQVDIAGKGESEPFRFDDPGLYTKEQRNQAHRRVEFVLR